MDIQKLKEKNIKVVGLEESLLVFMPDLMEKFINKKVVHCVTQSIEIEQMG